MLRKHLRFHILLALIFTLQLISGFVRIPYLANVTLFLYVMSLLIMLAVSTQLRGRFHKRVFTGLAFALAGNVLLGYAARGEPYFICGLAAYLLCPVYYTTAFYLDFRSAPELDKRGARITVLCCALVSISFYFYLRPHLGIMKLPVMIYILVISMMVMMAGFRNQRVSPPSFKLILFGALCFLLSEAILASHKFVTPVSYANTWIMATNMIAQYLIIIGAVERRLLHHA